MVVASSLMYEFGDKEQNVYVHTQIPSPLKDGGEISLNGDVSIMSRSAWVFFSCILDRSTFVTGLHAGTVPALQADVYEEAK